MISSWTATPISQPETIYASMNSEQSIIEAPIFIIGSPRSGTTWLQRLLLSHPEICGGQETHFFSSIAASALRLYKIQQQDLRKVGLPCYWSEADLRAEIFSLWQKTVVGLVRSSPNAKYLLEKTPDHARFMDVILEVLPKARFIHLIRDSRSVVSSLLAANNSEWGKWAPNTPKKAAVTWFLTVREAVNFGSQLPPDQYYELRYEDLKTNTQEELEKVFNFLKIPIQLEELKQFIQDQDFKNQRNSGGTALAATTGQPGESKEPEGFFRKGELDSWKKDLSLLDKLIVWRFTRKLMRQCGYRNMGIW
jgi:LPS sulfotransferase NodH